MEDNKPGLRQRQLQQTRTIISEAAFDLFEERGIAAVTVDEIAQAAGVSPRTFFRHFPVKEYAASGGVEILADAVDSFEPTGTTIASVFDEVLNLFSEVAADPHMLAPGGPLRFRKLMMENRELRTATASREAEIIKALGERLIQALPNLAAPALLLVSETALSLWRTAWLVWTDAVIEDSGTDLTPSAALGWSRGALLELHSE